MLDVANYAGVHQTTVSLALRNDRRLPWSTRQRIQRIAEKMGYCPHPMVSALIALRRARHPPVGQSTIAFLRHADPLPVPPLDYVPGLRAAAGQQGYRVDVFTVGRGEMTDSRVNQVLLARNIHAVVVGPFPEAHGTVAIDWAQYCTVTIGYTLMEPELDRVVHDHYHGMQRVMQECRRRRFARVGLILTPNANERTEYAYSSAYWGAQKSGAGFRALPPLLFANWDEATFARWFRRHRPVAIVTSRVFEQKVLSWCRNHDLRPGGNVHLFNLNAVRGGEVGGIFQNPFTIGSIAARMVIEKLLNNDRGLPAVRRTVLTPGAWLDSSPPDPRLDGTRRLRPPVKARNLHARAASVPPPPRPVARTGRLG